MVKGNISINKTLTKDTENGSIVQELPEIEFEGEMFPLFTPISPTNCSICGKPLKPNEHYDRFGATRSYITNCLTATPPIRSNPTVECVNGNVGVLCPQDNVER
jgi:hypothetical protein